MSESLQFDDDISRRLEAVYLLPDLVRRRSEALRFLQLRSGERVLDIGPGPGFLASQLGSAVGPSGSVCGVDSSDSMINLARSRCIHQPWVEFQSGEATKLPLKDEDFDVGVAVQVYEYVEDIPQALSELYRVLRPGGRALIVDMDWGSIVWNSTDESRMGRVLRAFDEHLARPHLARVLGSLLAKAGFLVQQPEVLVPLSNVCDPNTYGSALMDLIRSFVPGRQGVTQAEADAWFEDLRALGERGEYFFSLNQYFFRALKPPV